MRQKKPDKRKVQGAETKKKLLEIAKRLFEEYSFADVSIEDITDEAGITKGAFYVHYESKDALIAIVIADYATRADAEYRAFVKSLPEDMPVSEMILALADKISDVLSSTIGLENMKKVYQMLLLGTADTDSVKGYGRELYLLFRDILDKGIRKGELKSSLTLDELSRHFVLALRGLTYEWCIRYPDFDLKEQTLAHCRLLLEGIVNKPL